MMTKQELVHPDNDGFVERVSPKAPSDDVHFFKCTMAFIYKVEEYELDGPELDTFYKLFWFGSQDDGDLPSKSGMAGLIEKELAVKSYRPLGEIIGEKPNSLTLHGADVARKYYHAKQQVPSNLKLEEELADLINRRSLETNMVDTPDFLLARYIVQCLQTYQHIVQEREHWHGSGTKSECTDKA